MIEINLLFLPQTENIGSGNLNLFEGDMILTLEQRAAAEAGQDVDAPVSRGSIRRGLWKGGVLYYRIDRSLSESTLIINFSMFSCLCFKGKHNIQLS